MVINVVGRGLEVTEAIRTYAEGKALKLTKYYDGLQQVTVTISKKSHAHKGEYDVELVLDVEKHDDFVSHAGDENVYAAIDLVSEKGERQLRDFKTRLKGH